MESTWKAGASMKKNEKEQPQRAIISPELVEQAKAGDQNAFTELYRLTNVALYQSAAQFQRHCAR